MRSRVLQRVGRNAGAGTAEPGAQAEERVDLGEELKDEQEQDDGDDDGDQDDEDAELTACSARQGAV